MTIKNRKGILDVGKGLRKTFRLDLTFVRFLALSILSCVIPAKAGIQNVFFKENKMASYVYILASQKNGTLYVGVTSDLIRRIYEHKSKLMKGFTAKYNVSQLVYYETYNDITEAILREKQLKKWKRAWKLRLIEQHNPHWEELY